MAWAPRCAACEAQLDTPLAGSVCRACWRRVVHFEAPVCARCGGPLATLDTPEPATCPRCRRTGGPPIPRRAVGPHEGSLRQIVHAFKYGRRRTLADPLAALVRAAGHDWIRDADLIVPVPLHPWRRWQRGFNQAADLARRLGPPVLDPLRRTRLTPPQATLTRADRQRALIGAIGLRRGPRARSFHGFRGRCVLLVDDVITTGATVDACAAVLRGAGAGPVRALSVTLA